jgi:N-acetyl-alpha-D-glucosaminyl L-malate synthase BshA
MRIAIACFPGLGGSGVVASELAHALAARDHRIWVVATELPERLRVNGVRFERVDVPTSPVFEHAPYGLALAGQLVRLVQRELTQIDVVHLHYAIPHAASAMLAKQTLGAAAPAFVTTMHGTDVTRLGSHPSLQPVIAHALAACDGLTVPSQYLRGEAVRCFGLPPERIEVISNFVDVTRFAPTADRAPELTLFHVSNFRPVKRTGDLVDVLAALRETTPARMILVGDGPERAETERRAKGLPMQFLGKRDDFASLLAHADAFVLTSEIESFGVAALEAMAAGVPVYGYRVGGLPEVVTPETGALVPLGDTRALAAAIREGLPQRDARGRAARARAESEFRAERIVDAYEAYFKRVHGGLR